MMYVYTCNFPPLDFYFLFSGGFVDDNRFNDHYRSVSHSSGKLSEVY